MGKLATLIFSAMTVGAACGASLADALPEGAVKLTAAEAKAVYSGKSSNWDDSRAYFSPDGKYVIISKKKEWYAEGKWGASGNKVCASVKWTSLKDGKTGNHQDCWVWYKAGKKYWTLWSGDEDRKNGYYDGEMKKLRKGDNVTKAFLALKNR